VAQLQQQAAQALCTWAGARARSGRHGVRDQSVYCAVAFWSDHDAVVGPPVPLVVVVVEAVVEVVMLVFGVFVVTISMRPEDGVTSMPWVKPIFAWM
jgi:hypothetical protein